MSKSNRRDARQNKRAKFSDASNKRKLPVLTIVLVGAAVLAGAVILWQIWPSAAGQSTYAAGGGRIDPTAIDVTEDGAQDGAVRLPLSVFDDGRAHFYTYQLEGGFVEFFVLKSSDGVVRAAFNACDACYPAHRGYHQEGDEMVCNNCGQRFPSTRINEVRGGCNPAPLDRLVEGDELIIQVSDILAGSGYFQ